MREIFINDSDGRLRAGWRILFFILLYFSVTLLLALAAISLTAIFPQTNAPRDLLLSSLIGGIAVVVSAALARRSVDRKSVESLGLEPRGMWGDTLAGIGIAGGMVVLLYGLFYASGWLVFEGFTWQKEPFSSWSLAALNLTLAFLLTGISEEIMIRGYILQNAEEGIGRRWAVIFSSVLFGVLHLGNPGGSGLAPVIGITLAGLFFAYAYLRTRSLWLAIGLHIGWNWFLNAIFGFTVSGVDTPGLLNHTVNGPVLLTGGDFGPEAGAFLLPVLLAGTLLVKWYTRAR